MGWIENALDIDWNQVVEALVLLTIAFILALPLGLNREKESRGAGLRTFPLVSMACCAVMRIGIYEFPAGDAEARIAYGIMTGIGFIGGGAILKNKNNVSGTATAASIWSTGAIGIAVAYWRLEIALALSFANFMTLWLGTRWKRNMNDSGED